MGVQKQKIDCQQKKSQDQKEGAIDRLGWAMTMIAITTNGIAKAKKVTKSIASTRTGE